MRIRLLPFLLLVLPLWGSLGAKAADVATEGEIFAAYCLGIMEGWQGGKPYVCPHPQADALCLAMKAKAAAEAAQNASRAQRLDRYLRGQGYPDGRSALARDGIGAAHSAGKSDAAECPGDGTEPVFPAAVDYCKPKCGPAGSEAGASDECITCMSELSPSPSVSCRMAQRCNDDLSRLPY